MTKVMLVTGASRGIGAATARLAAERGYDVAVNYAADSAAASDVVEAVQALGRQAIAVKADVASEAEVADMFAEVDARFGRLDALVNNAGILFDHSPLAGMDVERWQRVLAVNVVGTFLCTREAIRRMSTATGGSGGAIVNLSSIASVLGAPGEYVDYAASKGAVDAMTIGVGKEVADQGIRVNAVRPGLIYTDIHASGGMPDRVDALKSGVPMRRGGTAEEVAEAILWLCSDAASYTVGTFLTVSGGR